MAHAQVQCTAVLCELSVRTACTEREIVFHSACVSLVRSHSCQGLALRLTPLKHPKNTKAGLVRSRALPCSKPPEMFARFVQQGKVTLKLPPAGKHPVITHQLLLSNCDPQKLRVFLITLQVKCKVADCLFRANVNKTLHNLLRIAKTPADDPNTCASPLLARWKSQHIQESVSMLENVSVVGTTDQHVLLTNNLHQHFLRIEDHYSPIVRQEVAVTPQRRQNQQHLRMGEWISSSPSSLGKKSAGHCPLTSTPLRKCVQHILFPTARKNATQSTPPPHEVVPVMQRPEWCRPLTSVNTAAADSSLNEQQQRVLQLVLEKKNVFFTGGAGTGKSFLIRKIIEQLPPPPATIVTASTGVAAFHIGGRTVHSFGGVARLFQCICSQGMREAVIQQSLEEMLRSNPEYRRDWLLCQYFILDEISLIDADSFTLLHRLAGFMRGLPDKAFGGLQIIVSGDFLQLPPVRGPKSTKVSYAFQSETWSHAIQETVQLTTVHRQNDPKLIALLHEIRLGRCSASTLNVLHTTRKQPALLPSSKENDENHLLCCYTLCTHRYLVDEENSKRLRQLPGEMVTWKTKDTVADAYVSIAPSAVSDKLDSQCPAVRGLSLKVNARVMLVKNLDVARGLVNGTRGVVLTVQTPTGWPTVRFFVSPEKPPLDVVVREEVWRVKVWHEKAFVNLERRQLPLVLAWAFSVHKSQGMTLDFANIYIDNTFECGQAYVALSRCRSLSTMRVLKITPQAIRADPIVLQFYESLSSKI